MLSEQSGIQVDKFYPPTDWQYSFPEGYTRLEYLESTGIQSINTLIPKATNINTKLTVKSKDTSGNKVIISYCTGGGQWFGTSGEYYSVGNVIGGVSTILANTKQTINIVTLYHTSVTATFTNGESITRSYQNEGQYTKDTYYLFGGLYSNFNSSSQIYSCIIKDNDNGTLLRNLVPVKRNSDNKPGMYDLVNDVFYVNQGTVEFIMGPELYSNNSQIDIRQKNNTNFVEKYKFNENNELIWANPQLNLSGPVNYNVVGNLTIMDNVVSGFSENDYLTLPLFIDDNIRNYEFYTEVVVGETATTNMGILTYRNSNLGGILISSSNKVAWRVARYIGTTIDFQIGSDIVLSQGDNVKVKCYYKGNNTFSLNISVNNGNWIEYTGVPENEISPLALTNYYATIGRTYYQASSLWIFNGFIDLKETYIKVNNKLWFYGKNYTSENYAPVPAGLNYNNTTTPSIGYVNTQTQEFIPAPTDGIKYSQTRDIKVIPPEDNTITLLYGVASDFSKYALFGLQANVSSGTYDVYIDDVLYATTASATLTDIDFSTLGAEYVSIGTCTTPEELVLHKIVIKPTTSGETITKFACRRTTGATGMQQQGILWANLQLENIIQISNCFGTEITLDNRILYALTAKNNKITVRSTSTSTTGIYSMFAKCVSLIYSPVLEYETKNYINGVYLTFDQTQLKRVTIKNNPSIDIQIIRNAQQLEKIDIENPISLSSGTAYGNSAQNAYKLELLPKYETETRTCENINMYYATSLYPTKINDSTNKLREFLRIYGSSTYPMRGLRGLKVSNEAPFSSTSSPQINVSYTGLDRAALVELFESMPGYMKLTKVGEPTIDSNGVASGFSNSNYLQTTNTFNPLNAWEMIFKVHFVSETAKYFTGYNGYGFVVGTTITGGNKRFKAFFSSNGTSWNLGNITTTVNISNNTDYYVKVQYTGNNYKISQSTNGINYVGESVLEENTPIISGNLCIGNGYSMTNFWDGSIDLKNSYITINNARYQFQLPDDTTTRAINITAATGNNLTKVGSPTIDSNGVASGFSGSDYLKLNLGTSFQNLQSFEFYMDFITGNDLSSVGQVLFTEQTERNTRIWKRLSRTELEFQYRDSLTNSNKSLIPEYTIQTNTRYKYKVSYTNGTITAKLYNADNNVLATDTNTGINPIFNGSYISFGSITTNNGLWGGSIDLNNSYIKVNNNYIIKGYLLDSDRLIATNKGWTITG